MWGDVFNAAIEAMKNAHKEEMEKTHRSQLTGLNSDIDELRVQYEYVYESSRAAAGRAPPLHVLWRHAFLGLAEHL